MATNFHKTPGVRFVTHGGTIVNTPPPPSGDTVLIVGQALDGPVNRVMRIQGVNLNSVFGPTVYDDNYVAPGGDVHKKGYYSGNNLVEAVHEVLQGGATSILVMRVGGTLAADATTTLLGGIKVEAQFPGQVYNATTLTAVSTTTGTVLTATQPTIKGGNFTVTYDPAIPYGAVTNKFNTDPRNGSFRLTCTAATANNTALTTPITTATATLTGGTYGTLNDDFAGASKSALWAAITDPDYGALAFIDAKQTDFLYFAGLYADDDIASDPTKSPLTTIAQFCETQSNDNYPVHAFMGVRPIIANDRVSVKNRVTALLSNQNTYLNTPTKQVAPGQFLDNGVSFVDSTGTQTIALGKHLSIHAGPDVLFNHDSARGAYVENPVAYYAGMIASRDASQGGTNIPVGNTITPFYTYTNSQIKLLDAGVGYDGVDDNTGGGAYVTFKVANEIPGNDTLRVTKDVTCDLRISVYAKLQAMRIVNKTEAAIGKVATFFLGQPSSAVTIMNMQSNIRTALDSLAERNYYNGGFGSGYKFTLVPRTGAIGVIDISCTVRPAFEITDFNVDLTVDFN